MLGNPAAAVSPAMVGRERELGRISELLRRARDGPAAAVIRIAGASGYGKTALVNEAMRAAAEAGWLVFEARCYAGQRRTPGAALRRLVADRIEGLSTSKKRYLSGLELELKSASTTAGRFELAFTRLIEGFLVDHACVLAFDDAQWLDQQTIATLQRLIEANPARPLVVVAVHQAGNHVTLPAVSESLALALEPLGRDPAEALVRTVWPDARTEVTASIVDRSSGVPFDLIALAQQARAERAATSADVSRTAHTVLRETIAALPDDQREFLQLCSLMREPIDLSIVQRVVADESNLDSLIARSSGRYLALDGSTLRFNHNLIADAARSTISSPLRLRRRIIAAYLSANSPRAGDFDRIATLAAEIGDRETEFRALTMLAAAAYAQDAYETVIVAFERALQIRRPDDQDFVTYYNQYTMALRLVSRWSDARRILEGAVFDGIARSVRGVGLLASTLLWIIRMETDRDAARSLYREFHD